jgi:hypothetical protein
MRKTIESNLLATFLWLGLFVSPLFETRDSTPALEPLSAEI